METISASNFKSQDNHVQWIEDDDNNQKFRLLCLTEFNLSDTTINNGKLATHDTGETDSSEDDDNNNFNNPHNMLCPPEMTRIFKNEPIDPIEQDQKRIRFT